MAFEARLLHSGAPPKPRHDTRYQSHVGYDDCGPDAAPVRRQNSQGDRYENDAHRYRYSENHRGDQNRNGRQRSSRDRRRTPRIAFADAIGILLDTLNDAHEFYDGFKRAFDKEVSEVADYAGPRILGELWENKVRNAESRRDRRDVDGERADPPGPTFRAMHQELNENFDVVMTTPPSRKSRDASRGEDLDKGGHIRLVAKLKRASVDIFNLTRSVTKKSSDTRALITELEMIMSYLDKSQSIWCDSRKDNDDFARNGNEHPEEDEYAPEDGGGSASCRRLS